MTNHAPRQDGKMKTSKKAICLNCRKPTNDGRWICDTCVGAAVDAMSPEDMLKAAKLGLIALVDEVTGYQSVRANNELYTIYFKYLQGKEVLSLEEGVQP